MLSWPVDTALESGLFAKVVVSTDDEAIRQVALDCGAEVSFPRPTHLSDDYASTVEVVSHEVRLLLDVNSDIQYVCCIYPAAFAVTADDLSRGLELLTASANPFVAAVSRYVHPVQRAMRLAKDGSLGFVSPDAAVQRPQDLEELWHDSGQFYWGTAQAWLSEIPILRSAAAYCMDGNRVVDIDTEDDWKRAELLIRSLE